MSVNILEIFSLSLLICLSFADKVNECSPCQMPCRVSTPSLPRSDLIKIYSNSVDNYRVTTVLDGYEGHFKITISQSSTDNSMYFAKVNVPNWRFDAHCRILCETPEINPVTNYTTQLMVSFPSFRSFHVSLQPAEDYTILFLYERVGIIQNELYGRVSVLEKRDQTLAKLKYAISNATITGDGWTCEQPNPMMYPSIDRHCWIDTGNWVYFDLKEKFTINFIRFRLHNQHAGIYSYTYNLAISPDGINWVTIADEVTGSSIQEYLLDNPTEVQFIKMEGRSNSDLWIRLCSFSVDWV